MSPTVLGLLIGFFVLGMLVVYHSLRARRIIKSIKIENDVLSATTGSGKIISFPLVELCEVTIVVTDDGPFDWDVFWELRAKNGNTLLVPHGIQGSAELLDRLQRLSGFDNKVFADAMCATQAMRLRCWPASDK